MQKVLNLYKPIGWTPLKTIQEFKKKNPEYTDVKMAYAGRLDPMAHGVLLVLVGDECKKRENYQRLDKEYEFEVLFGVSTDTYDILGLIDDNIQGIEGDLNLGNFQSKIEKAMSCFKGKIKQSYPPYSSKAVNGKKLFQWAKEGRLDEIEIPENEVEVYSLDFVSSYEISVDDLRHRIQERIKKVEGDFRQVQILEKWNYFFERQTLPCCPENFNVYKFKANVGSGTYIRSIANGMGEQLGCGAIAYDIHRSKVSQYKISESMIL